MYGSFLHLILKTHPLILDPPLPVLFYTIDSIFYTTDCSPIPNPQLYKAACFASLFKPRAEKIFLFSITFN